MTFIKMLANQPRWERLAALGVAVFALAACAANQPPPLPQVDAVTGEAIINAGDIAIAGQEVSHSLMDLPEVADAETPPLVRFAGVTSAVMGGEVDVAPYTGLLRDRLLLLTREKLRFVERQLPPLAPHKIKNRRQLGGPIDVDTDADYQLTARLRGSFSDDFYLIEIRLVDLHSDQSVFSGLYRIRRETSTDSGAPAVTSPSIESTAPNRGDPNSPTEETNIQ